jgi:hypothetical protein
VSKAGAAFSAAAGHNITPGFAGHALKESVFAAALAFLGLISSLWHCCILTRFTSVGYAKGLMSQCGKCSMSNEYFKCH